MTPKHKNIVCCRSTVLVLLAVIGLLLFFVGCASQSGTKTDTDQTGIDQMAPTQVSAIQSVRHSQTQDNEFVFISADGPLTFSSLKQPYPLAVVLYLPETTSDQLPAQQNVDSTMINSITANSIGNNTTRIEIQLAADMEYTAVQEDGEIKLTFVKSSKSAVAEEEIVAQNEDQTPDTASQEDQLENQGDTAPIEASSPTSTQTQTTSVGQTTTAQTIPKTTAWVNKVEFLSESEGKSTLIIGTTHAVNYQINKVGLKNLQMRLHNTRIPSYRQRPLITTRFNSAVDRVIPFENTKRKNETLISIELREAVPYFTEQTGNLILVHFEPSSIPPKPLDQARLPDWKQVMISQQSESEMPAQMDVPPPSAGLSTKPIVKPMVSEKEKQFALEEQLIKEDLEIQAILSPRRKRYTGEKIALDFYDTDIKNVFRIIREVSGKNFAIDKDVTGKVTMTLDKPVPWDHVLDLVLRMNQLGMSQEGDIIRIATVETLKKEDDLRKAKLEALKKARDEARALEPLITKYIPVSYSSANDEVKPHIEKILTKDRGSVTVDEKNNQIIVTDTAAKVRQAEDIVRRIDKVTAQVIIEARVVEVSNNFSKELGIDWTASYGPGVIPGTDWNTTTDMAMNLPSSSSSSIGINFSRLSGVPFVLHARLNALEVTGEGRILSSPKILTLDNKKAKIKQGVEYPYLERDSSGGSSVKFKNIDLLLEVTPHVTPDNRISLIIYITKNDVAGITAGVPSVATNEAETELLVNDGDTIVIGGIIKSTENKGETRFPGLSRIPLLGWLFKNKNNKQQSNELLIFITPRIVQLEQVAQTTIQ